jgi:hypothetical protein
MLSCCRYDGIHVDVKSRVDFIRQYNTQNGPLCGVLSKSVIGLKDDVKMHAKVKMEKRPGEFDIDRAVWMAVSNSS